MNWSIMVEGSQVTKSGSKLAAIRGEIALSSWFKSQMWRTPMACGIHRSSHFSQAATVPTILISLFGDWRRTLMICKSHHGGKLFFINEVKLLSWHSKRKICSLYLKNYFSVFFFSHKNQTFVLHYFSLQRKEDPSVFVRGLRVSVQSVRSLWTKW